MISAIPCLGPYFFSSVAWIWWIVSAIFMIKQGHDISTGRAAVAVLALPLGLFLLLVSGMLVNAFFPAT